MLQTIMAFATLALLVLSIIFILGIIWRVEKRLDRAYKFIFAAFIFLLVSQGAELFVRNEIVTSIIRLSDFLFASLFLGGVWMTRNLFRNIDGEK